MNRVNGSIKTGPQRPAPRRLSAPLFAGLFFGALTLAGLTLAAALFAAPAEAAPGWQRVASKDGVDVYVLPDTKRDVPLFKGVTTINAPILTLLAILTDVDRACAWNLRCHSVRTVRRFDDLNVIFYNRLSAPWPVDDRDAIYHASARIRSDGRRVDAIFRAIPRPEILVPPDVVRFPRLIGTYRLDSVNPTTTKVTYQIDADPGGMIPDWFVRYASKGVPTATLSGLRREAARVGDRYAAFMAKYATAAATVAPSIPAAAPRPATP